LGHSVTVRLWVGVLLSTKGLSNRTCAGLYFTVCIWMMVLFAAWKPNILFNFWMG